MRLKPFVRVCAMCAEKKNKHDLVRFCKTESGIVFAENGLGKGIYICKNCAKNLADQKTLCKAFRMKVSEKNANELLAKLKEI